MRRRFIAGNWKMFNGPAATSEFMSSFVSKLTASEDIISNIDEGKMEVAVFAPFISLDTAVKCKNDSPLIIGAQNMHWEKSGAFTGEVSGEMLKELGCTHVIIGHSERRHIFHETSEDLHKKLQSAIQESLISVFCVGELLQDRESGSTFDVIREQLMAGLKAMDGKDVAEKIIVAYEPVWAIGTGKTASSEDAQEVCAFIRKLLADTFGEGVSEKTILLYGGSVKPENTASILAMKDIDGVLVGGASLKPDSFLAITKAAVR
ncbi:MAG: triose-phosphate isomerase [Synergistaceae bacterium]|nr:triose-phosphate isomerase [Synergistaceae bacterium]